MGDRAVIVFDGYKEGQPGLYLHWGGYPDSVEGMLERLRGVMLPEPDADGKFEYSSPRSGDPEYAMARLAAIACGDAPGNLSVGIGVVPRLDCDNCDNGTYVVESKGYTLAERHHVRHPEEMLTNPDEWEGLGDDAFRRKVDREVAG